MGPSYDQLANDILPARVTALPLVQSCQPLMCALGLRCQPGDLYIHAGPPLIGPDLSPYLLVRVYQSLSLFRAVTTVNRIVIAILYAFGIRCTAPFLLYRIHLH